MGEINATAGALLGYLNRSPLTGWQIAQRVEEDIADFWHITRSQVYRELAAMAEAGLVTAGEKGVRAQVPYTITEAGRAAFLGWLHEDPGPEILRSPLHLKLAFADSLEPSTRDRFVRQHRARNEERLAFYEKCDAALDFATAPIEKYLVRSGISFRRELIGWLDTLPWGK